MYRMYMYCTEDWVENFCLLTIAAFSHFTQMTSYFTNSWVLRSSILEALHLESSPSISQHPIIRALEFSGKQHCKPVESFWSKYSKTCKKNFGSNVRKRLIRKKGVLTWGGRVISSIMFHPKLSFVLLSAYSPCIVTTDVGLCSGSTRDARRHWNLQNVQSTCLGAGYLLQSSLFICVHIKKTCLFLVCNC